MDRCDLLCLDLDKAERLRTSLGGAGLAEIAGTAKALGDPTRLGLALALAEEELCGCDLAWISGKSEQLISHHLLRLKRAGIARSRRDGKVVFYALTERGAALLDALAAGVER